jgi:transcription antitermination factor NusG
VRIYSGPFKDLEGYVQKVKNRDHLIISLHLLQRSVAVELETAAVQVS